MARQTLRHCVPDAGSRRVANVPAVRGKAVELAAEPVETFQLVTHQRGSWQQQTSSLYSTRPGARRR